MFYYPDVLQRHSGCFSTIWLAATKGIRITRREILKVNIIRTCEDIIEYVMVKVPPVQPSLPRPRFSLYLSAQLHYGIVIVYHRQCGFLLEEAQQTIERLLRTERHARIDMQEPDRLALNNPDPEVLMEQALEPFFGVMGSEYELPSPYALAQSWQFLEVHTPERPSVKTPRRSQPEVGHTASPECITLKENELTALRMPEYGGAELVEPTAQEIDMLLKECDHLIEEAEDREKERRGEREKTLETDAAMVSVEQLKETMEMGPSVEDAMIMVALEMTPPHVTRSTTREGSELDKGMLQEPSSSLDLEPQLEVPQSKRGRRRQLLFADQHTQISQSAMQEQINDPLVETVPMSEVSLEVPAPQRFTAEKLLSAPCGALLHPDLLSLWKQCAVLTARPGRRRAGQEEEEEERGQERSALSSELGPHVEEREVERRNRDSSVQEVLRESMESRLHLSELSSVSDAQLDVSKEDKALDPVSVPAAQWSVTEEAPSALHMDVILEEPPVELPPSQAEAEISRHLATDSLFRAVSCYLERFGKISFDSLLPPEADRCTVAHVFYNLLELVSEKRLNAHQPRPFDPITVMFTASTQ